MKITRDETVEGISQERVGTAMKQLELDQRILDYDTKEFTIELLVKKFGDGGEKDDFLVPSYQRRFNWDYRRQSRFIESLLIGLPIPFLFFADLENGQLEIVDGRQRLETCKAFLSNTLILEGLERLEDLNDFKFCNLSDAQKRRFRNRTIRSVVLSQNASEEDRRDLFDRINTGSLIAEPVEVRRGSIAGPITNLIDSLAEDELFNELCPISPRLKNKREREELIMRFFAFSDGLDGYRDRISDFLDSWLKSVNARASKDDSVYEDYKGQFHQTMKFVNEYFPYGFRKKESSKTTPRVRFDAISVGVWLAISKNNSLAAIGPAIDVNEWLSTGDFFVLTTSSAANIRSRISNRIGYVQHMISGDRTEARQFLA